jgi:pyruvate kinase
MRRTRIVATLGPASESPEMLRRLIEAGVDVFRLNFSHGSQDEHGERIRDIRRLAKETKRPIGILQDLQGPKMRVGELVNHQPVELKAGKRICLTTHPMAGTAECLSVTYDALPKDVRPNDAILLDDGRLQLEVRRVEGDEVICEIVVGGELSEHKGINLPHTPLSAPCLTPKDLDDLRFGLEAGVDMVGLSFVRRPSDIEKLRKEIGERKNAPIIIAKIERVEAIECLEEIIEAADGIMVARGDLGVETSAADVPLLQKKILQATGRLGKPDITATQMLETMISNPRPSRAEATDVANAVFDGTDALMLSAETAVGRYPVEAVKVMAEIAERAEEHLAEYGMPIRRKEADGPIGVEEGSVLAACRAADEIKAAGIVVFTISGRTAFRVASRRTAIPVFALTPKDETVRQLSLAWGVTPIKTALAVDAEEFRSIAEQALKDRGLNKGELLVMLSGSTTTAGGTNIIKIHRLGDY